MAPFRSRDRSARTRGQVEHNVLEGLPIQQYREIEVTVAPPQEKTAEQKGGRPELPMPPNSEFLPEWTQNLLRAARAGLLYKRAAVHDEEKDKVEDEEEAKPPQEAHAGFTVRKYVKIPRSREEPEPEYLAKRRKGLPSQYALHAAQAANAIPQGPMRETQVKKVDADGNATVYKVLVPEGQTVEGEIKEAEAAEIPAPAVAAPGTVVEGVGVVNADGLVVATQAVQTPPRRNRPPPPKKKGRKSGPGRGKKKVVFEPGAEGSAESATPAGSTNTLGVPGNKQETGSVGPSEVDTPMPDAQEGENEEGEEGDEGSEDDDREGGETPLTSNQPTSPPKPASSQTGETAPAPQKSANTKPQTKRQSSKDPSSSPELPLATAISHSRQNSLNQIPQLPPTVSSSEIKRETPVEAPPKTPTATQAPSEVATSHTPSGVPAGSNADVAIQPPAAEEVHFSDGDPDLFGSLERELDNNSKTRAG
ncbi:hypothetical protein GQ43DRAFT_444593 [Delitschia confertaspora ATCC 74209]|uniref:Uncharacterized protein n=1 Tax=Delitschia confertaspora ATCC 74209 TaxID=1513339 RepID=A0A9P4JGZ4_9PLEO|nr:hypothetical protein GQ43DRAFT_444593 [Delitschia confertaspora ATCC 74209]